EAIEYRVDGRNLSLLKKLESRDEFSVESHDLSIEQDRPIRKRPDRSRDVGVALGAVLRVARKQCHLGTLLVGEDAKPVVLLLVDQTGRVEGRIHKPRQHGSHAKGNAVFQARTSSRFKVGAVINMQVTAVLRTALPIAGGLPLVACSHFSTPSPSWNAT